MGAGMLRDRPERPAGAEGARPTGTALAVVLAVLLPPFGVVWGIVRVARGDLAFGAAVIAMSVAIGLLLVAVA